MGVAPRLLVQPNQKVLEGERGREWTTWNGGSGSGSATQRAADSSRNF